METPGNKPDLKPGSPKEADDKPPPITYVSIDEIAPIEDPPWSYYHPSGAKLHGAHEPLTSERIAIMRDCGFMTLALLGANHRSDELKKNYYYKTIAEDQLGKGNMVLVKDLFDDAGHVLLRKGTKMTREVIRGAFKRSKSLYIENEHAKDDRQGIKEYRERLERLQDVSLRFERPILQLEELPLLPKGERFSIKSLDLRIDQGFDAVGPQGPPLSRKIKVHDALRPRGQSHINGYSNLRKQAVFSLDEMFKQIIQEKPVSSHHILGLGTRIVNALLNDKDLLMNLVNVDDGDEYLKRHTVNTCIIAIQIATALGYDDRQVMEIAFGALFSDIGMYKVPESIRYKKEGLTALEWHEIQKHPVYSIDYISKLSGLPKTTPFIVYQVHERLDGSGYPKGRPKHLIHEYSRIVAIADVYDALINDRSHRPAILPYRAIETILKLAQEKKLDGQIIRAFLKSVGLFPVGSYVKLSDGRSGQVVGVHPKQYDKPVVSLMFEGGNSIPRPARVDLASNPDLRIVEVLESGGFPNRPFGGF